MAEDGDCFTKKEMMLKQSEFFAKTHPCHSDMAEVPMGENLSSLPPAKGGLDGTPSYLKNSPLTVYGDNTTSKLDYSCCIDGVLMERPFQTDRVLSSEDERYLALTNMMKEDSVQGLSFNSSIDFSFLIKADEYIKRIKKTDCPVESRVSSFILNVGWDWRESGRSDSIDSNFSVEV